MFPCKITREEGRSLAKSQGGEARALTPYKHMAEHASIQNSAGARSTMQICACACACAMMQCEPPCASVVAHKRGASARAHDGHVRHGGLASARKLRCVAARSSPPSPSPPPCNRHRAEGCSTDCFASINRSPNQSFWLKIGAKLEFLNCYATQKNGTKLGFCVAKIRLSS